MAPRETIIQLMTDDWSEFPVDPDTPFDEADDAELPRRLLRPWMLAAVAVLVAAVMLIGPALQTVDRAIPQIADNGLEVCTYDYCEVQAAIWDAGAGPAMLRFSTVLLSDEEAQEFSDDLLTSLGEAPVPVVMVDTLPAAAAGRYDPGRRVIEIERPASAWIVMHEVAHVASVGHDDEFVATLAAIARVVDAAAG